ncbi:glycosyltransferase family 25 protein [Kaistia defluvii]|uniref:glycosyltransferase family 25 protein n=1 Tax=Kaistia defluvii TaxID=410841 RepID=UPI00224F0BD6|nr:glycosyltransferase family 25 protein [Kaistia defluvii]MCX5517082.1 glycosyltransferase family 25 protein [Kaistia defluvii]
MRTLFPVSPPPLSVLVISLARMKGRRQLVAEQFRSLEIDYEFLDAIDASRDQHVPVSRYDEPGTLARFGAPLTPAEIACYASHYAAWQICAAGSEPMAICEDDLLLAPGFADALALAAANIDQHKLIRLFGKHRRRTRTLKALTSRYTLVRFLQGPIGGQCYCLSPTGAAALVAHAERWVEPVDQYIDRFWVHGLASNAILPYEVEEMDRTKIEGAIGERRQRRTGIAKLRREGTRQADVIARLIYNVRHWPR